MKIESFPRKLFLFRNNLCMFAQTQNELHNMKHMSILAVSLLALVACTPEKKQEADYSQYVNPMIGTDFTGNTYPGAQLPFGMVQLSPDNGLPGWDRISGYFYPDTTIAGFSHTHLSGTGAGDLYDISFMPVTRPYKEAPAPLGIYSTFSHNDEAASAGYYRVLLKDYNINVELIALFASALSCTSGGNTNDAGTQTAQTQALDSDGIPTGGEWITMFDGKTLNGWRGYCRQDVPQGWVVEDGSITYKGSDNKADTGFGDLIYDKKFKNFVFEIEWKIDKAGNSGIFYTAQEIEGTPIYYSSPEYQLLDNENMPDAWEGCDGNRQAGAVYDMIMPDPQPVKPYGNWNKTRIVVYNQRVIHYMNDVKVLEFQFGTPVWRALVDHSKFSKFSTSPEKCPEAYDLMLQCGKQPGYIGMQDHGYGVCFRNIRIKEL